MRLRYCLVMLFGMLIGRWQKPLLKRKTLAKKYNTERYNILEFSGIFTINDQF